MPPSAAFAPTALLGLAFLAVSGFPAPGLAAGGSRAAALRERAEVHVGAPVAIDPRLEVPACPSGFTFEPRGATLLIACPATGWRLVAPFARPAAAAPGRARVTIRRGDLVTVGWGGPGFRVTVEAIAEGSGGPGDRIVLRNRLTGQRFPATIGEAGELAAGT